jgi:hypothetical protein
VIGKLFEVGGRAPYRHPKVWLREEVDETERLRIGVGTGTIALLRALAAPLREPLFLVVVMRVPQKVEAGRWESIALTHPELDRFTERYGELFEDDARAQLWVGELDGIGPARAAAARASLQQAVQRARGQAASALAVEPHLAARRRAGGLRAELEQDLGRGLVRATREHELDGAMEIGLGMRDLLGERQGIARLDEHVEPPRLDLFAFRLWGFRSGCHVCRQFAFP